MRKWIMQMQPQQILIVSTGTGVQASHILCHLLTRRELHCQAGDFFLETRHLRRRISPKQWSAMGAARVKHGKSGKLPFSPTKAAAANAVSTHLGIARNT